MTARTNYSSTHRCIGKIKKNMAANRTLLKLNFCLVKVDSMLHALCIKCMTLIARFFLSSFIFARVVLDKSHISTNTVLCLVS